MGLTIVGIPYILTYILTKRSEWSLFDFLLIAINFKDGIIRALKCGERVVGSTFSERESPQWIDCRRTFKYSPHLRTWNGLSDIFYAVRRLLKIGFMHGVKKKAVHQGWTGGQCWNFDILKRFKSPLKESLSATARKYRKIPNISPELINICKHFLGGLYSEGGAYIRRAFCVSVWVSRL